MGTEELPWDVLWSELRLAELVNRSFQSEPPPWVVVALGAAGKRSAVDVDVAASGLQGEWAALANLIALRGFVRLGARGRAEQKLAALEASGSSALAKCARRELAREPGRALSAAGLLAEQALAEGRVDDAREALLRGLDDAGGETAALTWLEALPLLAGIEMGHGDAAAVVRLCDRFVERFPRSELALRWRFVAALAALYQGDRTRLDTLAHDDVAAKRLVQRLELSGSTQKLLKVSTPSLVAPGAYVDLEGREVLRRLLGDPELDVRPTSLAGIRRELERKGKKVVRCSLDEERLVTLLELDAALIVAEERPAGTGFVKLVGYERATGLLLLERFEQAGASLRTWDEQIVRSALHAQGALAILPDGATVPAGIAEARLDVLDACERDVREAHAGRGRAAHLAEAALAACPDVPRAWQLRGEALVEQLRAGEIESSRADGPIEAWYAAARTRFESAEWAHQIYATCLDLWNTSHEAAIAWADARALDENDYRNALGLSRNRLRQGYQQSAFILADEALARAPDRVEAWAQLAAAALEADKPVHADLAANAVLEVAPDDLSALRVRGVTLERRGELAGALALHERAAEHPSDRGPGSVRAALSLMRLGEFERAHERALEAMEKSPAQADGYRLAAMTFQALGAKDDAISVLEFGMSRVGPESDLLDAYVNAVALTDDDEDREQRVARALEVFGEQPGVLAAFAEALYERGSSALAERLLDAAAEAGGDSPSAPWRRACIYAKAKHFEAAVAVLQKLVDRTQNAYFVVLLDCAERKLGRPPSLDRLRGANLEAHPALVWGVTHGVAVALADAPLQKALEERLFGLPFEALLDGARFLLQHAMLDDAAGLSRLAARHPRGEPSSHEWRRVEHALLHAQGEYEPATAIAVSLHDDNAELVVIDAELDAAFRARNASALARLAEKRLAHVTRGANLDWGDGVRERALVAAAGFWTGNASAFEPLLARHAEHPALITVTKEVLGNQEARS